MRTRQPEIQAPADMVLLEPELLAAKDPGPFFRHRGAVRAQGVASAAQTVQDSIYQKDEASVWWVLIARLGTYDDRKNCVADRSTCNLGLRR